MATSMYPTMGGGAGLRPQMPRPQGYPGQPVPAPNGNTGFTGAGMPQQPQYTNGPAGSSGGLNYATGPAGSGGGTSYTQPQYTGPNGNYGGSGGFSYQRTAAPAFDNTYTPSPYLNQQIQQQWSGLDQSFARNTLPQLRNTANAFGNMGGSRAAIAEGLAMGDLNTSKANAATSLLGQDYTNAMNRNLQKYGLDSNFALQSDNNALGYLNSDRNYATAQGQLALGNRTADQNYSLGMTNAANNRYATDTQASTSRYGVDAQTGLGYAGLANQKDIAGMQNATQRYGIDSQTGLGYAGLTNQANIAGMQNQTAQRGQDMSLQGQMAGYDTQRYLGDQNNATQRYGIDQQTGLGYLNANNNFSLGQAANQNQATQIANNYALGMTNADNARYGIDQNYNLGMTNANNNRYATDQQANIAGMQNATAQRGQDITWQNNVNNTLDNREQMRNQFYLGNRGQDITQLGIGANLYGNTLNTLAGAGGGADNSGFNWQGALGGLMGGLQLSRNLWG